MEVEHIIKTKSYFELTAEELAEVSNYASSEFEFNEMKAFLVLTNQTVQNEKIRTTERLDGDVLNYLNESYSQSVPWYTSVLFFLFPKGKSFFKYPAFQLVVTSFIIFGVLNVVNFSSFKTKELSSQDVEKYIVKDVSKTKTVKNDSSNKDAKIEELKSLEPKLKDSELSNQAEIEIEYEVLQEVMYYDVVESDVDLEEVAELSVEARIEIYEDVEVDDNLMVVEKIQKGINKKESRDSDKMSVSENKDVGKSRLAVAYSMGKEKEESSKSSSLQFGNQIAIISTPELMDLFFVVE